MTSHITSMRKIKEFYHWLYTCLLVSQLAFIRCLATFSLSRFTARCRGVSLLFPSEFTSAPWLIRILAVFPDLSLKQTEQKNFHHVTVASFSDCLFVHKIPFSGTDICSRCDWFVSYPVGNWFDSSSGDDVT